MKKLILILMMFISLGLYSQENKRDTLSFSLYDTFELGSYTLKTETIENINFSMTELIKNCPKSDSLVIKAIVTSSTDNKRIHPKLKRKLEKLGYEGSNKGLSQIRNDKVSNIVQSALRKNKLINYFDKATQIVNFETGEEYTNRYMTILFTILPIKEVDVQLITLKTEPIKNCIDCDSLFLARELKRETFIDSLRNTHGCRYTLTRKEYVSLRNDHSNTNKNYWFRNFITKGNFNNKKFNGYTETSFTTFVNVTIPEVAYIVDNEDLTKLKMNTNLDFRKKFVKKLSIGSAFVIGGVVCVWQGALIHPNYRHKYYYNDGVKFRIPDTKLTATEIAYYKKINDKADDEMKERRYWYIGGAILSGIGAVFVWDAFEYRKLSLQVASPNGIIGLRYTY